MKNFTPFSFLSLALVTLMGAGCTTSPSTNVSTDTSSDTDTNTQTATDTGTSTGSETTNTETVSGETHTTPLSTNTDTTPTTETNSAYADGTYSATGTYASPAGQETVPVTLTLIDGVITDVTMTVTSTNPASKKFQTLFSENFTAMVVGKSIDDVNLTKVSGSSLTPTGFNDAIAQIKMAAQG